MMSMCPQIIRTTRTRRATRVNPSAVATTCASITPVLKDVTTLRSANPLYQPIRLSYLLLWSADPLHQPISSCVLCSWLSVVLWSGDGSAHGSGVRGRGAERSHHWRRTPRVLLGRLQQHDTPGASSQIQLQLRQHAAAALPPLRIMGVHCR